MGWKGFDRVQSTLEIRVEMLFYVVIFVIFSFSYVNGVNDMSEETCETLPSEIHLTKGN